MAYFEICDHVTFEEASCLRSVETRFLKDRIRETAFQDRGKMVLPLLSFERMAKTGPSGYVSAMHYGSIKHRFPVETQCIILELQKGIYTPPDVYHEKCKAQRRQEAIRARNEKLAERLQAEQAREASARAWKALGGGSQTPGAA
jgi:hypothetical protein